MMSFFPGSTHTPRGRRDAGLSATTQSLPTTDPPVLPAPELQGWPLQTQQDDDGGTRTAAVSTAGPFTAEAAPDGEQASIPGEPVPDPVDEEPFVPKSRYVMGRSTKVLTCVLLVTAGVFAGSAIQKQVDAGTRGARASFSNLQGTGAGAGSGTGGGGTQGSGQVRRGGGSGSGGSGTGGAATGAAGAPAAGTGK